MPLPPAPVTRVNSRGSPQAFKSLDATGTLGAGLEFNLLEAFGLFTVQTDAAAVIRIQGSLTGQDWVSFTPDLTFAAAGIQDLAVPPVTHVRLYLVSSGGPVTAWLAATQSSVAADVSIGTVTVSSGADKNEDDAALNGAVGSFMLGVRNDAAATKTTADGDYGQVSTDAAGRVGVTDLGGSVTIDQLAEHVEDAVAASGDVGVMALGVRNDTGAAQTSADGDYGAVALDAAGRVQVGARIQVDANNSTTTPLAAGATFTGTATDIRAFQQVNVEIYGRPSTVQGDGSNAKASFFFEFSPDGTNWDISVPALIRDPGLVIPTPVINVGRFFRLRYVNDGGVSAIAILGLSDTAGTPTLQTTFRLTTQLLPLTTKELTRTLDQGISGSDPAGLMRAALMGKSPTGTYRNVDLTAQDDLRVGFDAFHITQFDYTAQVIAAAGSLTTAFVDVADFADIAISTSATNLIQGYTEWSLDGVTVNHSYTTPFAGAGDFHVPVGAQYLRIRVVNLAGVNVTFNLRCFGCYQATGLFTFPVAAPIDASFPAALVKAAITGADPQGTYANVPLGGTVTADSTTTPLGAGATFTGTFTSMAGIMNKAVSIVTDQSGTVSFDTSHDGVTQDRTVSFSVVGGTPFFAALPRLAAYTRIRYVNGATPQGSFKLQTTVTASPLGNMLLRLDADISDSSVLQNVRSVITGKNPSGVYTNVQTDAEGRLLSGSGSEFERILARKLDTGEEMLLDTEPTNTDYYIGVAADGTAQASAVWSIIRIYLSATKNPSRIRFRENVAWSSRTAGWT